MTTRTERVRQLAEGGRGGFLMTIHTGLRRSHATGVARDTVLPGDLGQVVA